MKIIFIINDGELKYLEYSETGILNSPKRRSIEIELTEEQEAILDIKCLGKGKNYNHIWETIESISLKLSDET